MEIQITSKKKQKNIFLTKTQNFVCECSKIQKKRELKKKVQILGGARGIPHPPTKTLGGSKTPNPP